jgi:hypothetical protein
LVAAPRGCSTARQQCAFRRCEQAAAVLHEWKDAPPATHPLLEVEFHALRMQATTIVEVGSVFSV